MGYQTGWFVPGRAMLVTLTGQVSVQDMQGFGGALMTMLDGSNQPHVHLVFDDSALTGFPTNLLQIVQNVPYLRHPRFGWVIIVMPQPNPVFRYLAGALTQVGGLKYRMVESMDEAAVMLHGIDGIVGATA